jgi:hypothetical protein
LTKRLANFQTIQQKDKSFVCILIIDCMTKDESEEIKLRVSRMGLVQK